jgi:ribose 5-phosphate isomerase A
MENEKQLLALEIAKKVQNNTVLAIGSGTTVQAAIVEIGKRVKAEKLNISCCVASLQSSWNCQAMGLNVLDASYSGKIDWGFDGADAVDKNSLALIKGKGGAMFQEKILASRCNEFLILVSDDKLSENLALASEVPVEVYPKALAYVKVELEKLGASSSTLRMADSLGRITPSITEQGNLILDVRFKSINLELEYKVKQITGVIESGLFSIQASEVWVIGGITGFKILKK